MLKLEFHVNFTCHDVLLGSYLSEPFKNVTATASRTKLGSGQVWARARHFWGCRLVTSGSILALLAMDASPWDRSLRAWRMTGPHPSPPPRSPVIGTPTPHGDTLHPRSYFWAKSSRPSGRARPEPAPDRAVLVSTCPSVTLRILGSLRRPAFPPPWVPSLRECSGSS